MILPLLASVPSQTGGYSKNATGMFCRQSVVSSGLMQLRSRLLTPTDCSEQNQLIAFTDWQFFSHV